tara:strand:+ start:627 stop:911 length:285 start_codon:yes stop_codon:yes gene_type:complete
MSLFLEELDKIIASRKQNPSDKSYTSQLFEQGIDRILRKVGEESGELLIAGKNNDPKELCNEASDLLYHLLVLLHHQGLSLSDIDTVLRSRHQK